MRIRSRARDRPIIAGRRTVPPSINGTPNKEQGDRNDTRFYIPNLLLRNPKDTSDSATLRSHQSANSNPPPTVKPVRLAITGLLRRRRDGPYPTTLIKC